MSAAARAAGIVLAFLHACRNPENESAVAAMLAETAPEMPVAPSSGTWPVVRGYERTITAVISDYVQPRVAHCLDRFEAALAGKSVAVPAHAANRDHAGDQGGRPGAEGAQGRDHPDLGGCGGAPIPSPRPRSARSAAMRRGWPGGQGTRVNVIVPGAVKSALREKHQLGQGMLQAGNLPGCSRCR